MSVAGGTSAGVVFRGDGAVRTTIDAPGAPDQELSAILNYFRSKARPFADGCYRASFHWGSVVSAGGTLDEMRMVLGPDQGQGANGTAAPTFPWARSAAGGTGVPSVADYFAFTGSDTYRVPVPIVGWGVWVESAGALDCVFVVVLIGRCRCDCGHEETKP